MDDWIPEQFAVYAGRLSFRPEVQVRRERIVACPADRNESIEEMGTLDELSGFVISVALECSRQA